SCTIGPRHPATPEQGVQDAMADKPIKTERGRKPKARKFYRMGPDLRVGGAPGYRVENVMTLTGGRTGSRTARGTPRLSRISRGGAPYHRPEARPGAARPRALRELLAGLRPHEVGKRWIPRVLPSCAARCEWPMARHRRFAGCATSFECWMRSTRPHRHCESTMTNAPSA